MFVLASSLSSSLSSTALSQSSPSLTAPFQPIPSRTVPSPTVPQPVPTIRASTTADTVSVSTAAGVMPASTAVVSNGNDGVPAWHAGFLQLLPAIEKNARIAFRRLKKEAREDAVAEVVANSMVAYVRLVQRGRQDVAFAAPLAHFAIAQYREGRLVGTKMNVRDVTSFYCQRRKGVMIERLDRWDAEEGCWQEVLVEDRTCTPAELAASRIDFVAWLATLSGRDRKIAKLLASGCGTNDVAAKVGLSWARISQLRRELKASWDEFHEPKVVEDAADEQNVAA